MDMMTQNSPSKMKLVHASLFSGIGGPEVAASMMGWQNAFHCEINPFGRRVLDYHFPESESYEDITKTDFRKWRGKIDVLTGGFPCFVAGTPVLTRRGFVPIDEVSVGDEVLTSDRTYHHVECTMRHEADKIVYMRAQGMYEELKCTPNHPFYVRRKETYYEKGVGNTRLLPAEYVKASEIKKGDKVGYPTFNGTDTFKTKAFWKLVGTWIADGWVDNGIRKSKIQKGHRGSRVNSRNHKVIICCGKKNIARLHHTIQAAGYTYTLSEDKSTFKCIICDEWLCGFLNGFGKYAHGKHLSPQCFMLDNERKRELLEGWFADGYKKANGAQCVTTVSERLVLDMAQIARDVYMCPVSISRKTCNRICNIEGREVNERPQYCLTISESSRYGFYEDGFVWCNVKFIREEQETNEVFNLSVNEEHSYNVYGIAVHNCQPFSLAGRRKGAEDDRYLWPEFKRVIREIRPTWVVGENVAGILTMVQPGTSVELGCTSTLFGESYEEEEVRQQYVTETVCRDLEREGYSVQPFLIPACAVGAPHRRDRVFFVAHRTDAGLEEVQQRWKDGVLPGKPSSDPDSKRCDNGTDYRERGCIRNDWERYAEEMEQERNERQCGTGQDGQTLSEFGRADVLHGICRNAADPYFHGLQGDIQRGCGEQEREGCPPAMSAGNNGTVRTYSNSTRQQGEQCEPEQRENGQQVQGKLGGSSCQDGDVGGIWEQNFWSMFPTTQPAVRGRDDGLSGRLDGITFSKWRQESLKAYGNAIVPEVMYEIFRAIEIAENETKKIK